jgi:hypothetical protein
LSELQNRRKHVLHDNSLKAGASDDDSDLPPADVGKLNRAVPVSAFKPASSPQAKTLSLTPASNAVGSHEEVHATQSSAAAPLENGALDVSACLRRLDRLPSTVEKCLKE